MKDNVSWVIGMPSCRTALPCDDYKIRILFIKSCSLIKVVTELHQFFTEVLTRSMELLLS